MAQEIKRACILIILMGVVWGVYALFSHGERDIAHLENIYGIPYARLDGKTYVEEELAHADVFLKEPVIGKELVLTVDFNPGNVDELSVGVRENSFWLSYPKYVLHYTASPEPQHAVIRIPLTDKFQEPDESIDVMFFAKGEDQMSWILHSVSARTELVMPAYAEWKDYVRSILTWEVAQ